MNMYFTEWNRQAWVSFWNDTYLRIRGCDWVLGIFTLYFVTMVVYDAIRYYRNKYRLVNTMRRFMSEDSIVKSFPSYKDLNDYSDKLTEDINHWYDEYKDFKSFVTIISRDYDKLIRLPYKDNFTDKLLIGYPLVKFFVWDQHLAVLDQREYLPLLVRYLDESEDRSIYQFRLPDFYIHLGRHLAWYRIKIERSNNEFHMFMMDKIAYWLWWYFIVEELNYLVKNLSSRYRIFDTINEVDLNRVFEKLFDDIHSNKPEIVLREIHQEQRMIPSSYWHEPNSDPSSLIHKGYFIKPIEMDRIDISDGD